jgi:hypothetical protein
MARHVIRDAHKRQLDLERGGAEKAGELCFGTDLVRHEIEKPNPQRPNVLSRRIRLAHDHDALCFQRSAGREVISDLDWHGAAFLSFGTTLVA